MSGQADRPEQEAAATAEDEATSAEDNVVEEASVEGEVAAAPVNDDGDLASELALMQAKADENWDRYLRTAAEMENVRKRASRDVENARKFALERFAKELLAVKDSLEMGLASAESASAESLLEGSEATLKILATTLQQFAIETVDPEGEPFDPELHEAISMQPSETAEPGSVLSVVQKGYTLNGRLLRPAMVIVAAD